jgi:hypothetical protein
MEMRQVAVAVFNDRTTEAARAAALAVFVDKGADYWDAAVHRLLPVVFAELRKPIYSGAEFDATAWTAAADVLEMELQHAIDCRERAA